jgi:hypothetical protein
MITALTSGFPLYQGLPRHLGYHLGNGVAGLSTRAASGATMVMFVCDKVTKQVV